MFRAFELGRRHPEIRLAPAAPRSSREGRRAAEGLDRFLPEPALFGPDLPAAAPPGAKRLMDEIGDQGPVTRLIEKRSDAELAALMCNLGGHDLPSRACSKQFEGIRHDRPVCFMAYTVKGFGTAAGRPQGQSCRPDDQASRWKASRPPTRSAPAMSGICFEGLNLPETEIRAFLDKVPFNAKGRRRHSAPALPVPAAARRHPGDDVDADGLRQDARRIGQDLDGPNSPTASSPPRPTSPSRPISAPG
jgi:hypothetical protein